MEKLIAVDWPVLSDWVPTGQEGVSRHTAGRTLHPLTQENDTADFEVAEFFLFTCKWLESL